jgi:hypothetical protein
MLRKFTLGLIAAASLGIAALAPGSASAHTFYPGWGYGWSVGPSFYINNSCYQQRWVQTRHGMRVRTVNVCGYYLY